jgi:hypothetical protein
MRAWRKPLPSRNLSLAATARNNGQPPRFILENRRNERSKGRLQRPFCDSRPGCLSRVCPRPFPRTPFLFAVTTRRLVDRGAVAGMRPGRRLLAPVCFPCFHADPSDSKRCHYRLNPGRSAAVVFGHRRLAGTAGLRTAAGDPGAAAARLRPVPAVTFKVLTQQRSGTSGR